VGHVKAERILARFLNQGGLSMRTVAEGQAFWCSIQVEAEDSPEYSVSGNKMLAVFLKVKPLGPHLLICRQGMQETLYLRRRFVQSSLPDMYFVTT
jgi:hypothetical protein